MDNEKAYNEALERARNYYSTTDSVADAKLIELIFPELKESEDEKIRKEIISALKYANHKGVYNKHLVWLEKQDEQKPTQEIESFEAEHGKYYYCIKDYFCGGKKQASKGDVVQALRGLPIMGLKDASEYFLPLNSIEKKSAWSEDDEIGWTNTMIMIKEVASNHYTKDSIKLVIDWLESIKKRIGE